MKLNFKFTNLIGTTYKSGNLAFTQNGSCLLSPVGNQVTIFHLLRDEARTIALNSHYNIAHVALSPILPILFIVNCNGEASLASLLSGNVITTYNFRHPISAVCFSPNGRYLAVAKNHCIMVFLAPEPTRSVNSLEMYRFLYGFLDSITNIDWSSDSKFIVAGSNDMTARILSIERNPQLIIYTLSGHKTPVFGHFYSDKSLNCVTVSTDGEVRLWDCDTDLSLLNQTLELKTKKEKTLFRMTSKFMHRSSDNHIIKEGITMITFHKKLRILISAFENGVIMLHQLPDFTLIDKAKLMTDPISSVTINSVGDWIAVGSEEHGQLAVWEWRSQTCHLRAESHANEMNSLAYSPDGLLIATSGHDAKIKVWQVSSGRAIVTFSDHQAPVSQVIFPLTKPKVILSASLDGTVRAFDLVRYRNFRTMSVSSRGVQLSCLAVDSLGELVSAGALDSFDAYVWSIKTGQLLNILTGHTSPVSSVAFNPGLEYFGPLELVTASWDSTVRTWSLADSQAVSSSGDKNVSGGTVTDVTHLPIDAICVAYRYDGKQLAVALLNAKIIFIDPAEGSQTGSIEGRPDLGVSQVGPNDLVTPHKAAKERKFLSIAYSTDGQHIIAGGDSKYICLYSIPDKLLVKRFEITINLSLEGVQEAHDRRHFLAAYSAESANAKETSREALSLPGVRTGDDHSRRWWRPDVRVTSVKFAPTGDSFAATATEGVFIYSLESSGLGSNILGGASNWLFDAVCVDEETTPSNARLALSTGNFASALDIALRLRIYELMVEVIESVPCDQINYLSRHLPINQIIGYLVPFLARQLEGRSRHAAFYVTWTDSILQFHASTLRRSLASIAQPLGKLKLTKDDADANETFEISKQLQTPGVLLERSEWRAFQASLVRLQTSLDTLKTSLIDRLESVDANWSYLSILSGMAQGKGYPTKREKKSISNTSITEEGKVDDNFPMTSVIADTVSDDRCVVQKSKNTKKKIKLKSKRLLSEQKHQKTSNTLSMSVPMKT